MKYEENIILEKIEASKRKLLELLSQKERVEQLNAWLKTELTYTSNGLEGSTLTRQETILAIEEQLTSGSKPIKHYWEAINHAKAFSWIYEQLQMGISIDFPPIRTPLRCSMLSSSFQARRTHRRKR